MKSIAFPKMFNESSTKIVSDYDATLSNLKLLLMSEKGELLGDPYFGVRLKAYFFNQNNKVLKDLLIDEIYNAVSVFMPQLNINRKDIDIIKTERAELNITIKAINRVDFTTNTYNLVLFDLAND